MRDRTMMLTPKQCLFVKEYLCGLNATQTAIRAGYSKKTADVIGYELLRKTSVSQALQVEQDRVAKKIEATAERVIGELAKLGFSNMSEFVKWDKDGVTLINSDKLTPDQTAAVVEVIQTETVNGRNVRIKLGDKIGALNSLARHLGLFKDKTEHSGSLVLLHPQAIEKIDDPGC